MDTKSLLPYPGQRRRYCGPRRARRWGSCSAPARPWRLDAFDRACLVVFLAASAALLVTQLWSWP